MLGKTYIITSATAQGEIVLKYNLNGFLYALEINADLSDEQYVRFFSNIPYTDHRAEELTKAKNSKVKMVPEDLSFVRFYEDYDFKVGKKVMAEKSWNRLSQKDKVEALMGIGKYNRYLQRNPNIAKAYPSTYLNQRYWENYR